MADHLCLCVSEREVVNSQLLASGVMSSANSSWAGSGIGSIRVMHLHGQGRRHQVWVEKLEKQEEDALLHLSSTNLIPTTPNM